MLLLLLLGGSELFDSRLGIVGGQGLRIFVEEAPNALEVIARLFVFEPATTGLFKAKER